MIPTAKEYLKSTELLVKFDNFQGCVLEDELPNLLIEFAKLHVQEASKAANHKVNYLIEEFGAIMPNSILNAYPLENIK